MPFYRFFFWGGFGTLIKLDDRKKKRYQLILTSQLEDLAFNPKQDSGYAKPGFPILAATFGGYQLCALKYVQLFFSWGAGGLN